MPRLLRMPEVAANTPEAVLQDWSVPEGQAFRAQDAIATVETDKAVIDVEAEEDGVVLRTLVPPGSTVDVGAPIALLADPEEQVSDVEAVLTEMGVVVDAPVVAPDRRLVPDDPEGGTANTSGPTLENGSSTLENGSSTLENGSAGPALEDSSAGMDAEVSGERRRLFASPLARRIAGEASLAIEAVKGTGPRGRILRRDVEAALASRPTKGTGGAVAGSEGRRRPSEASYTEIPHTPIRRATAARLTQSKQSVPHFYLRATIRADELLRLRSQLNDGSRPKVSVNDLVVKAVGQAHLLVPEMNVTWSAEAVRSYDRVDVGVAVATERGLLTPVVRDVPSLTISALSATIRDISERAQANRLRQEELEGGSIGVTNLGMYDVEEFAAIINPPQAAILAVGAAQTEPVVVDGALDVGSVMRVTLSVDHRPVDGVVAARWLRALVSLLENPVQVLA